MSMMCMPSAALQALVPNAADSGVTIDGESERSDILGNGDSSEMNVFGRPSMAFIVEAHNLADLKRAMKQAVRKAACRSYALQVSFTI